MKDDIVLTIREGHVFAFLAFVFGFVVAIFLSATVFFYSTPGINCVHEDSCYADYDGTTGRWHIIYGERPEQQILVPSSTTKE